MVTQFQMAATTGYLRLRVVEIAGKIPFIVVVVVVVCERTVPIPECWSVTSQRG